MEPLYGVLEMLVLRTLLFGPLHGYAIASAIRNGSDGESRVARRVEIGDGRVTALIRLGRIPRPA